MDYIEQLRKGFNDRILVKEKRPGIRQLFAPLYHEDGDMIDIFFSEVRTNGEKVIRISDFGMTLMRLSYHYDLNTPKKEQVFQKILSQNELSEENGNIYLDAKPENLYPAVMQFASAIAKISSMKLYKRAVIHTMFYELLGEFIEDNLKQYNPVPAYQPIENRDDLEVDYRLEAGKRSIFLFGAREVAKSRLITISCQAFLLEKLKFTSCVVHEDFNTLPKKDITRITSAVDKQFTTLDDFRENGLQFLERESA